MRKTNIFSNYLDKLLPLGRGKCQDNGISHVERYLNARQFYRFVKRFTFGREDNLFDRYLHGISFFWYNTYGYSYYL